MKEKLINIVVHLLILPYLLVKVGAILLRKCSSKFVQSHFFKIIPLLTGIATLFAILNGCAPGQGKAPATNIILITVDALRTDALSLYGNRHETSPALDKIAQQGAYFTEAVSSFYNTQPAMASLMTGKFPSFKGVTRWDPATYYGFSRYRLRGEKAGLTSQVRTLAEILSEAGYMTAGFNTNPYLLRPTNFNQGFQHYLDFEGYYENAQELKVPLAYSCAAPVGVVMDRVFSWLSPTRWEPFFLWVHLMDVHFPYLPPEPYNRMFSWGFSDADDLTLNRIYQALILKQHNLELPEDVPSLPVTKTQLVHHLKGLYHGELRLVDDHLAKLWELLAREKLLENTLLIITSDHGEEFMEHGYLSHHGFTGGKEELVRIPLIMAFPQSEKSLHHRKITEQVRMVDIAPTILDYLGLPLQFRQEMDGRSLLPLIKGLPQPPAPAWIDAPEFEMIKVSGWKYVRFKQKGDQYLYHLDEDPGESRNLAEEVPSKIEELKNTFEEMSRAIHADSGGGKKAPATTPPALTDPKVKKRLRALGYAD